MTATDSLAVTCIALSFDLYTANSNKHTHVVQSHIFVMYIEQHRTYRDYSKLGFTKGRDHARNDVDNSYIAANDLPHKSISPI